MSIVSRWKQRRNIRIGLLTAARKRLAARKTKANLAHVHVRKDQVDFADRVIARHDRRPVASPLAKILEDSWGYHPGVHDGIDLICEPDATLYAICDAVVIDVRSGQWWGKGAPADSALREKGNGIIQLECLVDAGPFSQGQHIGYGHAEHARVKVGQRVQAGDAIGKAGFANAWHIHLMVNDGDTSKGVGRRDPGPFVTYARAAA